ncbi:cation acetate symporter [Paeniglutamicibacter sp. ZC-3]|uniref:solute symporter family protein n=1 Tax=Paeniglutamicibacter sp. ZC-3 TaxID=2986919 RepID=UPI0021F7CECF|nr:cation acetate symporter [Paeniglutamicibacter sp. ZC-3]MCV9994307.1 cation acetate symporter [Paeniglutamicibacter sp. ZC-3]
MNFTRLFFFAAIIAVTVGVTYWASRRTSTQTEFFAAGRSITARQNGIAIAGDLMSAATFLGFTGLIFLSGFDGWILATAACFSFLLILMLFAERMRNAGQYTIADVLSFRFNKRPVRAAAASATLIICVFYLIAQLVGAGVLIRALTGMRFEVAVVLTGIAMLFYVVFGGMLATTWVQIVKAVLLTIIGGVLTVMVLWKFNFNPAELFSAAAAKHPMGERYLGPGGSGNHPLNTLSSGLAYAVGTAALPHVLIRFFTVPDAKAARNSVGWAVGIVGAFFVMTSVIGYGARALLPAGMESKTAGGNLAAPLLAEHLGGGAGTFGGDMFIALVSAVAFATILAVVAGLLLSASGAMSHDLWFNVVKQREPRTEREGTIVARISAASVGTVAIVLTIAIGDGINVALLVGLALSIAASANFPALALSLSWSKLNTVGTITGIYTGLAVSVVLIALGPYGWPGGPAEAPFPLTFPVLVSIPAGFLGCFIGNLFGRGRKDDGSAFKELHVRANVGFGAESGGSSH